MKRLIRKVTAITIVIVAILIVAIAIPNVIMWKESKKEPFANRVPDGSVIEHDGKRHLVLVDQNGKVYSYIEDESGDYFTKVK